MSITKISSGYLAESDNDSFFSTEAEGRYESRNIADLRKEINTLEGLLNSRAHLIATAKAIVSLIGLIGLGLIIAGCALESFPLLCVGAGLLVPFGVSGFIDIPTKTLNPLAKQALDDQEFQQFLIDNNLTPNSDMLISIYTCYCNLKLAPARLLSEIQYISRRPVTNPEDIGLVIEQ